HGARARLVHARPLLGEVDRSTPAVMTRSSPCRHSERTAEIRHNTLSPCSVQDGALPDSGPGRHAEPHGQTIPDDPSDKKVRSTAAYRSPPVLRSCSDAVPLPRLPSIARARVD